MKKLLALLFLLLLTGVAFAENVIDEAFVGEWKVSVAFNGKSMSVPAEQTLTIAKDGTATFSNMDGSLQLTPGPQANSYFLHNYRVTLDSLGSLYLYDSNDSRLLICHKSWKGSFSMPRSYTETLSTSGEWQLTHVMYKTEGKYYGYPSRPWMELSQIGLAPLTLTLDPLMTSSEIEKAFTKLIEDNEKNHPIAAMLKGEDLNDATLYSDGMIILTAAGGWRDSYEYEICLTRTQAPVVDEEIQYQAQKMMGTWLITDMTLGNFSLPADSFREGYLLQIDEYGFVKLGDDHFTLEKNRLGLRLKPKDDNAETLNLSWTEKAISISDPASGVKLNFITYAEACWRELCGTWQISNITVTNIGLDESPEGMDFTLTLNEDYTAVLAAGDQEQLFTVIPTDSIYYYTLKSGSQTYQLSCYSSQIELADEERNTELRFSRPDDE